MSVSAIAATLGSTTASTSKLVQMASGEYTAASVTADPTDAAKLGLTKQSDGNYGTKPMTASAPAAANGSTGVQAALSDLVRGGS